MCVVMFLCFNIVMALCLSQDNIQVDRANKKHNVEAS